VGEAIAKMKKIYFVRHGETEANLHEFEPVPMEEPLNAKGFMQAEAIAKRVSTIEFEKLFASSYLRAQQTAEAIAKEKSLPIATEPLFREMTPPSSLFGVSYSHDSVQTFRRDRNENIENSEWRFEDGDTFGDLFLQIQKAKKILEDDPAESIAVVSHTFFLQLFAAAILLDLKAPTRQWLQIATKLLMSNTGVTLFEITPLGWKLVMWNDHEHFAE
jgi:broad specificity phosphatase PhoE